MSKLNDWVAASDFVSTRLDMSELQRKCNLSELDDVRIEHALSALQQGKLEIETKI